MTINGISGSQGLTPQQGVKGVDAKSQATIASILSSFGASSDVASVPLSSQLQAQTAGLKNLSSSLTQGATLAQIVDSGASQIESDLQQLLSLAQQAASPSASDTSRSNLDQSAQVIYQHIDLTVSTTRFNGNSVLTNTVSLSLDSLLVTTKKGDNSASSGVTVGNLTTSSLFGVPGPDLLTSAGASKAVDTFTQSLKTLKELRDSINAFLQSVDFASANVDTAAANQQAAQSTLTPEDLNGTSPTVANAVQNSSNATNVQGSNLNPVLQQLLS